MKKKITKEQVIETALNLMKNNDNLETVNFREIARTLGCAHTNLYNYFSSYNEILWESHIAIHIIFMEKLKNRITDTDKAEVKLYSLFNAFIDMYVDNKGWFRLAWHEYIEGERPKRDIEIVEETNILINNYIFEIWKDLYNEYPDKDNVRRVMHNTHCYIVGEVSNYILGRGLINDEDELKSYIVKEAINMFKLCLNGSDSFGI